MATKTTKRAAPPAAVALRKLELRIRRKPTAAARDAVRDVFSLELLEDLKHSLKLAEGSLGGVDPEAALVYLSFAVERLNHLVNGVLEGIAGSPENSRRST